MNVMALLLIALALFLSGAGTGWKISEWKSEAEKAAELKAQQLADEKEQQRTQAISAAFQNGLANLARMQQGRATQVQREVLQTIYTQCVLPDSGRMLLDSTATDINRALGFDVSVPSNPPAATVKAGSDQHGGSTDSRREFDERVRELRLQAEKTSGLGGTGKTGAGGK